MNQQELMTKAGMWRKAGIVGAVVAVLAAAFAWFAFHKAHVYTEQAMEMQKASDVVDATGKSKPKGEAAREFGAWAVTQVRPCQPGMTDITAQHRVTFGDNECGTVEEVATNFLADEGENDILACFYRNASCPAASGTAFVWALLTTSASPGESSTWSSLSGNECGSGTCNGYENATKNLTRDASGWSTLDTIASGTGGCTESSCARVSTAQQVVTATSNWSASARYLVIRVNTTNRLIASAQLSADRQLQNGDQLNLTYRQALQ